MANNPSAPARDGISPQIPRRSSRQIVLLGTGLIFLLVAASSTATAASTPPVRQYAPEREFDLLHLHLDVTPDFEERRIRGVATLRLQPLNRPLRQLHLDAVDLRVKAVDSEASIQSWHLTTNRLIVTFSSPRPADEALTLAIHYEAEPEKGLYWRTPELGYGEGETHLFTQGEAIEHRH